MDPESLGDTTTKNVPRKVRFAPKAPVRRVQPIVPKTEKIESTNDDHAKAQELLRRFTEASVKVKPKFEKKVAPTQVAFGYGGASSTLKTCGTLKGVKYEGSACKGLKDEKEYKEPWDYYSLYPTTLPLRRPYEGNPEILDEEEFGEAPESITCDEHSSNAAAELGLMEENLETSMFFLQFPSNLPIVNQEMAGSSRPPKVAGPPEKTCGLAELPAGFMGKISVYSSGAVKLKLGDTLYDVSAGLDCVFAQDAVAMNTEEKHCCILGELRKRAVITPDVNSILESTMSDMSL